MFELNKKIDDWKNNLLLGQNLNQSDVDELASHLMDSVDELKEAGLSEEESYWVSRHRLGDTGALSDEFSKVNQATIWKKRLLWLILGYMMFEIIPMIVKLLVVPIHLFDIQWLFTGSIWLYGPDFSIPTPIFVAILLLTGSIFVLGTSDKHMSARINQLKPAFVTESTLPFLILGLYILAGASSVLLANIYVPHHHGAAIYGNIAASTASFSLMWNAFLMTALTVLSFVLIRERRKPMNV